MEAAKRERDVASRELSDAIRQAERYTKSTNRSLRIVKQRITKMNEKEERLRSYHYTYCEKAKIPFDNEEAIDYLTERIDAASDCTDACTNFIDDRETDVELEKRRTTENEASSKLNSENERKRKQIEADVIIEETLAQELVKKIDAIQCDVKSMNIALLKTYDWKLNEAVENLNKSGKLQIAATENDDELKQLTIEISKKNVLRGCTFESRFSYRELLFRAVS